MAKPAWAKLRTPLVVKIWLIPTASRAATPPTAIPLMKAATVISEEHAQVLGVERRLVEDHLAAGDLPADAPVDPADAVVAGARGKTPLVVEARTGEGGGWGYPGNLRRPRGGPPGVVGTGAWGRAAG